MRDLVRVHERRGNVAAPQKVEFASAGTRLHHRLAAGDLPHCEVWALSPSGASIQDGLAEIAALIQEPGETRRAVLRPERNPGAVVIWIDIGGVAMLLASDLEADSDESKGWTAAIAVPDRPPAKASVFKIPHHGSIDAHDDEVWTELLEEQPNACLTPHLSGRVRLPRDTDRSRICALTDRVWTTRPADAERRERRSAAIDKTIDSVVHWIRDEEYSTGAVRLRRDLASASSPWTVDLLGTAQPLCTS